MKFKSTLYVALRKGSEDSNYKEFMDMDTIGLTKDQTEERVKAQIRLCTHAPFPSSFPIYLDYLNQHPVTRIVELNVEEV